MTKTGYLATGAALVCLGIGVAMGSVLGGLLAAGGAALLVVGWRQREDHDERRAGFQRRD